VSHAEARTRPPADLAPVLPVAAGIAMLLLRIPILRMPDAGRVTLLAAVLAAILVTSLLVPLTNDVGHVRPALVIVVGLAGVALAALVAGRPIAAPLGVSALPLALFAAVAEEALFRRAAYGWLARSGPSVAVVGSALLFAAVHVPLYGVAALPVDLGAGLLLSWQRWASGTWTAAAATHAAANLIAVVLR
jgi:membrane protease YdiL (CAAX protease family)